MADHALPGVNAPRFAARVPDGDSRERQVCESCGFVAYENPKIVVGSVVALGGRVLLCRRAIEPRRGFWTLPAGFLEQGETVEEGARREAAEEACADIVIEGVLGVFSIARLSQVQVMFQARFADPESAALFAAGSETLEAGLFAWDEIPWSLIAFPSVRWTLDAWHALGGRALGQPVFNPPEDPRGVVHLPVADPAP